MVGIVDNLPSVISAAAGLFGSIIGATATLLAQSAAHKRDQRDKRRSLSFALGAEIESYLDIIERRDRLRHAETLAERARSGQDVSLKGWFAASEMAVEFFPVFKGSLQSIGILGPDTCKKLGKFHREIEAVFATLKMAEAGEFDAFTPKDKALLIDEELAIWRGAVNTGKQLVKDLYAS